MKTIYIWFCYCKIFFTFKNFYLLKKWTKNMIFKNYSYSSFLNLTFSHFKLLFSNFLFQYFVIQYASTQFTGISIQNSLCYSPLQNACQRGSILGDAIPPGYLSLTFIDCLKILGKKEENLKMEPSIEQSNRLFLFSDMI